ncbi:Uncharacterised protein [Mycobacterium tuberculosis]|nr:Uncharacterised protein [Mycobacterium tuberculosis]
MLCATMPVPFEFLAALTDLALTSPNSDSILWAAGIDDLRANLCV